MCLTPFGSSAADTGYVEPGNPCVDPFTDDVDSPGGYHVATMAFTDFTAGETFAFTADVDPYSITGFDSAGNAGAISGLEASGATISIDFADGSSAIVETTFGDSPGGSSTIVPNDNPTVALLDVQGVTLNPTGYSNGATAAYVTTAGQVAEITGPANTDVELIVVDAALEDAPDSGFFDLDPFERNKALSVIYLTATTNGSGIATIPFTVSTTPGESTYLLAATDPAGAPSNPVYLEIAPDPSPVIAPIADVTVVEGDPVNVAVTATNPDGPNTDIALSITTNPDTTAINLAFTDAGDGTGSLAWTTTTGDVGSYEVTITANDGADPASQEVFTITVLEPGAFDASSTFEILAGNDSLGASTFGADSFVITNTSTAGVTISSVVMDLSTALYPDMVFDPDGDAGDATASASRRTVHRQRASD